MINSIAGHYTNTLKLAITSATNLKAELDWLIQNKVDKDGWNLVTIYGTSPLAKTAFAAFALECYLNKIRLAVAFTAMSEVDASVSYNNKQTDSRKKLVACVTEYEDYTASNGGGDPVYYKNLLLQSSVKLKANGMLLGVYQGWSKSYEAIVTAADFMVMTYYRTSPQMASATDYWRYMVARYTEYAAAAKKIGKVFSIIPMISTEPAYGQDYMKTHTWDQVKADFKAKWDANATLDMKQYLIVNQLYVFVTSHSKVSKPLTA